MTDAPLFTTTALRRGILALAFVVAADVAGAAETPRATVEATANRVIDVLKTQQSADEKRRRLEEIGMQTFDFDTVSKLVLAKYWKQLSPDQQAEFQREFRKQLSISYGRRIDRYGNETVEIVGERTEPRGDVTVLTKVTGGATTRDVKVEYRLRKFPDGDWRFIDVVVEGISVVGSYRSQFQEVLSAGGPDHLLAELRAKNAAGESAVPEDLKGHEATQ